MNCPGCTKPMTEVDDETYKCNRCDITKQIAVEHNSDYYTDRLSHGFRRRGGRDHSIRGIHTMDELGNLSRSAGRHEKKGNYLEAAKIYRVIFESIHDNMNMIDDSYGTWSSEFNDALESYAGAVNKANLPFDKKATFIKYMFSKCLEKEQYGIEEEYLMTMQRLCTTKEDLILWESLLHDNEFDGGEDSEIIVLTKLLQFEANHKRKARLYALLKERGLDRRGNWDIYLNMLLADGRTQEAADVARHGLTKWGQCGFMGGQYIIHNSQKIGGEYFYGEALKARAQALVDRQSPI